MRAPLSIIAAFVRPDRGSVGTSGPWRADTVGIMTVAMQSMAPRPLDDHAWRAIHGMPGVAHFFGTLSHPAARSHCWSDAPITGTRQAAEDDRLCPDCEAWYWEHAAGMGPCVERGNPGGPAAPMLRVRGAARTAPDAPWVPD